MSSRYYCNSPNSVDGGVGYTAQTRKMRKVTLRFEDEDSCVIARLIGDNRATQHRHTMMLSIDELISLGIMARHEKTRRQDVGIWKEYGVTEVVREEKG